jgi:VanZ family protein
MLQTLFRLFAWLLVLVIIGLSVVPASARPVTSVGHNFEHLLIFALTGLTFKLGYSQLTWPLLLTMPAFAGGIELVQLAVPSRHARLEDFVVDALAAIAGVLVAHLGLWMMARTKPTSSQNTHKIRNILL